MTTASRYALIDGNNFYCSCERLFQPWLNGRPLVVLSNNDGCAIARSEEAKQLGVRMGAPYFQLRELERRRGLVALSANFALYGTLSERLMRLAAGLGPEQEVYSIDECFVRLLGKGPQLSAEALALRERIWVALGIPCCIGIGPTKTLAKLANYLAKKNPDRAPVFDWTLLSVAEQQAYLERLPAHAIWGVGPRLAEQLAAGRIHTALDLARLDPNWARAHFSVVLERTVRELGGHACLPMTPVHLTRQHILVSRSFGQAVHTLEALEEAIGSFTSRAAEKLRQQHSLAQEVQVFIRTSHHRSGPQCHRRISVRLPVASDATPQLLAAALRGLRTLFQPGFAFVKGGVMLSELSALSARQAELTSFDPSQPRSQALMHTIDALNTRYGARTVQWAVEGPRTQARAWHMRQQRKTPAYTTRWDELPLAHAC